MLAINGKKFETKEVIKIEIDGKVYSLPLAKHLPYKTIKKLTGLKDDKDIDVFIDILSEYIPVDVIDELSITDIGNILQAWNGTNEESGEDLKN